VTANWISRRRALAKQEDRAFGQRLERVRIKLGMTEQEAAAAIGRDVRTWRKYVATGVGRIYGQDLLGFGLPPVLLNWLVTGELPRVPRGPRN
jgi:hypothetical protein